MASTAMRVSVALWIASCGALVLPNQLNLLKNLGPAPESDPRWTNFRPPGSNDVRSPCPGLNSLANHNFIHHDGRNLTIPHLISGLAAGLNVGADFTTLIGGFGLLSSPQPLLGSFDLNHLDQHNFPIEHDGSLSRRDAYSGDDHSFDQASWNQVLAFYHGSTTTNLIAASAARYSRINSSHTNNPTFTYGLKEFVLSYGETALYLQTMGSDDSSGVADLRYVKMLFEQEKLPYELGWRPRKEPVTLNSLGEMILGLYGVSPEPLKEGFQITKDSYKDVLEIAIGGSEILGNLTGGISHALGL